MNALPYRAHVDAYINHLIRDLESKLRAYWDSRA